MKFHKSLAAAIVLLGAILPAQAFVVQALSITSAQNVNISVTGFYTGGTTAGINHLLVDGVAANGFCIDPFHFAVPSAAGYQYTPLANAPKAPATMGAIKADQIARLWTMAYSPTMSATQAAAFQIAVWEIVAGSMFTVIGNDYGAHTLLTSLASFTGPGANLVGLTGPGQDYVIQDFRPHISTVPDQGATVLLLVSAMAIMLVADRWLRPIEPARLPVRD